MLIRLTFPDQPLLPEIQRLYEVAFPLHERRHFADVLKMLHLPEMHFEALKENNNFIGFVIWWQLQNCLYVEHIAIYQHFRGQRYGQTLIQKLMERAEKPIILETEIPNNETAIKRVRFYERLGFQTIPVTYQQPPYRKGEEFFEMLLMSTEFPGSKAEIDDIILVIKQQVYERFY